MNELPKAFTNLFGGAAAKAAEIPPEAEAVEVAQVDALPESVQDVRKLQPRKPKRVRARCRELKLVLPESVVRELKVHASKGLTTSSEVVLAALRQYIPAVREVLKRAG